MSKRGDGIYLRGKTWWLDVCIKGIRFQRSLGKNISRSVALQLAQVERTDILRGKAGIGRKPKDISFEAARMKFDNWAVAEKRATTLRGYRQCLTELARTFGEKRLSAITPWALDLYKQKRTAGVRLTVRPDGMSEAEWKRRCRVAEHGAPIRVNRELAVLKTLFNRCKDWGLYEGENPVRAITFRKEPKTRLRILDVAEEARLLAKCEGPLRALVLVGLYTGLRVHAEALTLRWEDVDLKRRTLTVLAAYAKNNRTRTVSLNTRVHEALTQLKRTATTAEVFAGLRSIRKAFNRACRRAKVTGVTPHTLRHTFASRLVMSGADLRTVQELGGWQTIGMVERYSHLSPSHKADAVERLVTGFPYDIPYAEKAGLADVS